MRGDRVTGPLGRPAAGLAAAPRGRPTATCTSHLDAPLPAEVGGRRGHGALRLRAGARARRADIRALSLVVDGDAQPVMAQRMPRLDVLPRPAPGPRPLRDAGLDLRPGVRGGPADLLSYRSGFWGFARGAAAGDGERELVLRAELDDGPYAAAELGRLATVGPRAPAAWSRRARRGRARRDLHGDLRPAARTCSSARSTRSAPRPTATGSA